MPDDLIASLEDLGRASLTHLRTKHGGPAQWPKRMVPVAQFGENSARTAFRWKFDAHVVLNDPEVQTERVASINGLFGRGAS